jgi:hypothetical protein
MSDLNNQSQILLSLKKHHSDEYSLDYYNVSELPQPLADAYWKDHMIAARPAINGTMSVYTWDFEAWRDRYLKQLMLSNVKVKAGND